MHDLEARSENAPDGETNTLVDYLYAATWSKIFTGTDVTQQLWGSNDCGLCICAYAARAFAGLPLTFNPDMSATRRLLNAAIQRN